MLPMQQQGAFDSHHALSPRERDHRMHYSRVKSAAITACFRLMQVAPYETLVQQTANAAVNGERPARVQELSKIVNNNKMVEDVVQDQHYNHLDKQGERIKPIVELCLIKATKGAQPPPGFFFASELLQSKQDSSDNETEIRNESTHKPVSILTGSGEEFYLCYRRQASANDPIKPITDIQIISYKSVFPLTYKALNHTYDGQRLPYFQNPSQLSQSSQSAPNAQGSDSNPTGSNQDDGGAGDTLVLSDVGSGSKQNGSSLEAPHVTAGGGDDVSSAARGGASMGMDLSGSNNVLIDGGKPGADGMGNNKNGGSGERGQAAVSFQAVPLIVYSRAGHSPITNIKYVNLGQTVHACYVILHKTLDDQPGDLNNGIGNNNSNHRRYIAFAKDLTPYRFSAQELDMHVNLKYLTPLLVSLHLRKADLAITALESLKYLLLSNFIRFKDYDLRELSLTKVVRAVCQSYVTWNTNYHSKLMEMQIILFQKYIHHLRVESIWNMLMSSLAPIKNDWSRKFLSKYIDTCFRYVQVLAFGMSLDEDGAVIRRPRTYSDAEEDESDEDVLDDAMGLNLTPGGPGLHGRPGPNGRSTRPDVPAIMRLYLHSLINRTVREAVAERNLAKFFQTPVNQCEPIVSCVINSLFVSDEDLPWRPLCILILWCSRWGLAPNAPKNASRLRERVCRMCCDLLDKILFIAGDAKYVAAMPASAQFLLRRTICRLVAYNLCNKNVREYDDIFDKTLLFFERVMIKYYTFFQHEIGALLSHVILPQLMERFTPLHRRYKFLKCIENVLSKPKILVELTYSLDVVHGKRAMHGIVDSLMGLIVEFAHILKQIPPKFELANYSNKSYQKNYEFQQCAVRCLVKLTRSFADWYEDNVMVFEEQLSEFAHARHLVLGRTERQWQKWLQYHTVQQQARDLACKKDDDKACKRAIELLQKHNLVGANGASIATWLHAYRGDIPASSLGDYIGGSRPKEEKPIEEETRQWFIRKCGMNFDGGLEHVMAYFLTRCGFRMPREAQKIERVLESFAFVYCENKKSDFERSDAAFVVFNAILMLNTSLHNPQIKEKDRLKLDVFVSMCIGVAGQKMLRSDYERIFKHIRDHPYEISFEDEQKSQRTRQYMEWKRKHLQAQRRPMLSNTKVLNSQIKNLPSYSSVHSLASHPSQSGGYPSQHASSPSASNSRQVGVGPVSTPDNSVSFDNFGDASQSQLQSSSKFTFSSRALGGRSNNNMKSSLYQNSSDENAFLLSLNDVQKRSERKDEELTSVEQKEIEAQMLRVYKQHASANLNENMKEYAEFCNELLGKAFFWISEASTCPAELVCIDSRRRGGHRTRSGSSGSNASNASNASGSSTDSEDGDSHASTQDIQQRFELACLLLDNWWARILDATKIVLDSEQDPFITPTILSIFPYILKISLNMRLLGHAPSRVVFDGYLSRYATWWTDASGFLAQATKDVLPNNKELHAMRDKFESDPQSHGYKLLSKLDDYVHRTQRIIKEKKHRDRLTVMGFEFDNIKLVMSGREFWGQQTVLKIGHNRDEKTYQLFLFNDMLLYASGRVGKYKVHRVLFLVFCILEDLPNGPVNAVDAADDAQGGQDAASVLKLENRPSGSNHSAAGGNGKDKDPNQQLKEMEDQLNGGNAQYLKHAFRIHSPQKTVTFALPNAEYKRMVYNKINEGVMQQRQRVNSLLREMEACANDVSGKGANGMKGMNGGNNKNGNGARSSGKDRGLNRRERARHNGMDKKKDEKSTKSAAEIQKENERCRDKLKLYLKSCAFLHQSIESVKRGKQLYSEDCKLCLKPLKNFFKSKGKTCPVCNDGNVCNDCMQRRSMMGKKKVKVCDGCYNIIENRLTLPFKVVQ